MPVVERAPVTDDVTSAFIGGGFAGLMTGARLKQAGIGDVRIIDQAGDFGGTWYRLHDALARLDPPTR